LRLTAYEVLQRLVSAGCVEKMDKRYRAKADALGDGADHVAAEHCRELLAALQKEK
jgi:hypothetical protein